MGLWDSMRSMFTRAAPSATPPPTLIAFVDDGEWVGKLTDDASFGVYADWLEERGDGRAELVRLGMRQQDVPAFVDAHAASLLGPLATRKRSARNGFRAELELQWDRGVLRGAGVRSEQAWADLDALLALPVARHLTELGLGIETPLEPLCSTERVSTLARLPQLSALLLADFTRDECEMSWAQVGDVAAVWSALPRLEQLTLRGLVSNLGAIDAPQLTRFVRETSGLTRAELAAFSAARWPCLEHFELWFGDANYGAEGNAEDVLPVLKALPPTVTHLGLRNCEFTDELIEVLVESGVLPRLQGLDLSLGCLTDAGAARLLERRTHFEHLTQLMLDECLLSEQHLPALAALGPTVSHERQRLGEGEPGERYVAVGE
jgi:uncharacterized protein (TIGR02996 family)